MKKVFLYTKVFYICKIINNLKQTIMKTTKTQRESIKEILQTELLKRGFIAPIIKLEEVADRIEFETENFQTVPVLYKSINVSHFSSAITERDHVRSDGEVIPYLDIWITVNARFESFSGGSNGTEIFAIIIEYGRGKYDHKPWKITIR